MIHATYITSGITGGLAGTQAVPWQAKCKNRAPT